MESPIRPNLTAPINQQLANMKVLLMGRAGAGKTSMRSIIFANYLARDTKRLTPTTNVEHSNLRFLGNLVLSLWDCGGQDTFMENYFESQRESIFRHVEVLIYVIEVRVSLGSAILPRENTQQQPMLRQLRQAEIDLQYFKTTTQSIKQYSPNARVFCLLHKMDLVKPSIKEAVLTQYTEELTRVAEGLTLVCFGTSIWDETLYKAWSQITNSLLPNIHVLEKKLKHFCELLGADEVVLFERSTFLVISRATLRGDFDPQRFEKISNISKQFKLTCAKTQSNFSSYSIRIPNFLIFMERFTLNTYLLVLVTDKDVTSTSVLCNIDYAREEFENIADSMSLGPRL